jgi:Ca2+-binding EF-hand superfamily protein
MMMRKFLIAGLMAAAASPLIAQASAPVPPAAPRAPVAPMAPMAPDRIVTRAEVDARVRAHFAELDTNRDGYVTTQEMSAMRSARGLPGQQRRVEHQVMRGDPAAAFDRIDANHDGSISRDEFAKGHEVRIEKRVITQGGAPGAPGLPMRMKMHGGMMGAGLLRMADTDKDGRVSLAEATGGAMQHFDMMDANRDGRLTPEERRAGRGKMRQMRNPG